MKWKVSLPLDQVTLYPNVKAKIAADKHATKTSFKAIATGRDTKTLSEPNSTKKKKKKKGGEQGGGVGEFFGSGLEKS